MLGLRPASPEKASDSSGIVCDKKAGHIIQVIQINLSSLKEINWISINRNAMEQLQVLLESLLREYFHVVPVHTQRQDQWYKRQFNSWKRQNPGYDLLVLSPKHSKSEWAPRLSQFVLHFATSLHDMTSEDTGLQNVSNPPSDAKLFEDQVLDENNVLDRSRRQEHQSLRPSMQRLSFWTAPLDESYTGTGLCTLAIQELLKRGQIQALLYLARHPKTKNGVLPRSTGWQKVVDDTLELLIFLMIVKCFPENLAVNGGWKCWLPIIHCRNDSAVYRYLKNSYEADIVKKEQQMNRDMERCFQTLHMAEILWNECRLPALDWEKNIIHVFLSFTGFEMWNRMRSGSRYLGCTLNTVRDVTWLQKQVSEDERLQAIKEYRNKIDSQAGISESSKNYLITQKSYGKRCPMELSKNKDEKVDIEEDETHPELALFEAQEAEYGLKRSIKYQHKISTITTRTVKRS